MNLRSRNRCTIEVKRLCGIQLSKHSSRKQVPLSAIALGTVGQATESQQGPQFTSVPYIPTPQHTPQTLFKLLRLLYFGTLTVTLTPLTSPLKAPYSHYESACVIASGCVRKIWPEAVSGATAWNKCTEARTWKEMSCQKAGFYRVLEASIGFYRAL